MIKCFKIKNRGEMPLFFCGVGCAMFIVGGGLCIVLGIKSVIFGVGMRKKAEKWRISAVFWLK